MRDLLPTLNSTSLKPTNVTQINLGFPFVKKAVYDLHFATKGWEIKFHYTATMRTCH